MKNIAIILARSGSKGLPDKNIKVLCGKPLMAHTIKAALDSGMFDTIHVSTDSDKYASIACEYGAEVPFLRSAETSSDAADSWDAVYEVLQTYKESGRSFDTAMLLQPTSPLRTAVDIQRAYELMKSKDANAVISVCEADHPPAWFHPLAADGEMSVFASKNEKEEQRQNFEKQYRINGALYLLKMDYFLSEHHHIFRDQAYAYIMDKRKSIDIDEQFDFDLAEAIMKLK